MKISIAVIVGVFMAGCITSPEGKSGMGFSVPIKIKDTDLGALLFGWIPPDSVTDGRYGQIARDGKSYFSPL